MIDIKNKAEKIGSIASEELIYSLNLYGQKKFVTVFGSARTKEDSEEYARAVKVGRLLSESGFNVMTGGGPGIMQATNQGAHSHNEDASHGASIKLPFEVEKNRFISEGTTHKYFFTRKFVLIRNSLAFVCMEGGFGTLDELFEVLTLIQTQKIERAPVVLVGKEFWTGLIDWASKSMLKAGCISQKDLDLIKIVDTPDEAVEFITKTRRLRL